MKVAIFCDYLHSFGGTEYYNAILASELKRRGIDVRVYIGRKTQNPYWIDILKKQKIKVYEPKTSSMDNKESSIISEFVSNFINDFVSWKPDIIHASPSANLLSAYIQNKKIKKVPIVATEHTTPCIDSAFWYPTNFNKMLKHIKCFIATCKTSSHGIKNFHKYMGSIKIIPHFIKSPILQNVPRINNSVGCIARMSPEKGIGILLVAWKNVIKRIPSAKLYLYGDGRAKSYFERLNLSLGLQNSVIFAGTFDPKIGAGAVANKHDIFVQPSLFESIPTSLIELGMLGKPIIATNVGGIKEIINKNTGILVKSCSTDNLSKAIIDLLSNKKYQNELANNIKLHIANKYDLNRNISMIIDLYKSFI